MSSEHRVNQLITSTETWPGKRGAAADFMKLFMAERSDSRRLLAVC